MLTHSPPNTPSQSNPVVLIAHQRDDFNPYGPTSTSDSVKDGGFATEKVQLSSSTPPLRSHSEGIIEGFANFYGAVTRMCGFNEKYSLGLCACETLILLTSFLRLPLQ